MRRFLSFCALTIYAFSIATPARKTHCHLLYHMESGMMREVRVEE
jgi:FtsP/CotA-like multicopper oxidase with cupredoxin domain